MQCLQMWGILKRLCIKINLTKRLIMSGYDRFWSNFADLVGACLIYIGVFQASSDVKIAVVSSVAFIATIALSQIRAQNALSNSTVWRSHVQKFASLLERIFSTSIFKIFTIGLNGAFLIFFAVQTYNTPKMTTLWLMPTLSIVYVFFCFAIVSTAP